MGLKVIIVCGGTGGHLSPGIATAQRIRDDGDRALLVVSEKEIDTRLASRYTDLTFVKSPGAGFSLSPVRLLRFVYHNLRGLLFSFRLLRRERPAIVLAFGGFMSVGYALSARLLGIPLALHEANRVVGRSIRTLSGLADIVYTPQGVKLPDLSPGRALSMGMPLRKEIAHLPKESIRRSMDIPRHVKLLVIIGGSQGAQALNDWAANTVPSLAREGIWTIVVTGPGKGVVGVKPTYTSDNEESVEVRVMEFHDKVYELFSCADLVVSRAGAGSVAELAACLCPSILVPFPHAADNHQDANARFFERQGGCIVVNQSQIHTLQREVLDIIFNDWLIDQMRRNLRQMNRGNAACQLVKDLHQRVTWANQRQKQEAPA